MIALHNTEYRLKYILVGASGCGKSTMAAMLCKELGLRRCVTSTTRPPRPGEVDGVDYHFRYHIEPQEMFEHAIFGGYAYGIQHSELSKGDFIILDPQGVEHYRKHYPAPLTVIQLVRNDIHVDPERMARDRAAGFDSVNPDIIVRGDTIEEMSQNLLNVIGSKQPSLDDIITCAELRKASPQHMQHLSHANEDLSL